MSRGAEEFTEVEVESLDGECEKLTNMLDWLLLENEEWLAKFTALAKNYDALNEEYVLGKRHAQQIEGLLNETKASHAQNVKQLTLAKDEEIAELAKEMKVMGGKLMDAESAKIALASKPTLSISELTLLRDKERELADIVEKMSIADQSIEPSFKCGVCCELFVDPVTCQPCGHSFCRRCIKQKKGTCAECKMKVEQFENEILENLTNTYKLRAKTYLPALRQIAKRKTAVVNSGNI